MDWRSLIGGGRLREVVAHGGSTVCFYYLINKIFIYDNHYSHSLIKPSVKALILDSDIKFKNICSQEKTKLLGIVDLVFFFSRSCSNVGITAVVVLAGVDVKTVFSE